MILLLAILAGLAAGLIRARLAGQSYPPVQLQHVWLVILSILPQFLAFYWPVTRELMPAWLVVMCLVGSQAGLLAFVVLNREYIELWIVGGGLTANLIVIAANRGLMPITPASVAAIYPGLHLDASWLGSQLGWTKNILLLQADTHFAFLSDRILLPGWVPWKYAFSLGDLLIMLGVFWLLWRGAAGKRRA
ncbi:MAG: DUF5317 domain-containing protein [Anaerolineales bacterium]